MKYSIIIPVKNQKELTDTCIKSIEKNTTDFELIIIDNGSKIPYESNTFIIRNETNLGFPKAINQGIQKSVGDIIILLNNDTVVSPNWTEHLAEHLKKYDMVSPLTNEISGVQKLMLNSVQLPEKTDEIADQIYARNFGKAYPYHRLVFFCVAIKREVINKVGLLDEQFTPGNCEDDDYCLQAIEAGFKLGIAEDTFIYHKGSATMRENENEYKELVLTNMEKLKAKWPKEKYEELIQKNRTNCESISNTKKQTLALVMVVKNEELGLARAIESVKNFVDEIHILVDKGSTDKTLQIAGLYTNNIKQFDWFNDFAGARNLAHKDVKTDWILFLDGHEFVTKHDLLDFMLTSPADALLTTVEMENGAQIRNPRIYRNGLQFEGKIHEIQNYKSLSVYPDFIVTHGRVGGQSKEAIFERNVQTNKMMREVMEEQVKENKKNTRASFHLALYYQGQQDFKKAIKMQDLFLKYAEIKGDRWFIYCNRALMHFALGHTIRALWALGNAEKETAGRWEIQKLYGMIYFADGRYKKAVEYLVESFEENKTDQTYKPTKRNNAETWNIIGECYFNQGKYEIAGEAFSEASKTEKDEKLKKFYRDRTELMYNIQNEK